jgi:hypothetical protein
MQRRFYSNLCLFKVFFFLHHIYKQISIQINSFFSSIDQFIIIVCNNMEPKLTAFEPYVKKRF